MRRKIPFAAAGACVQQKAKAINRRTGLRPNAPNRRTCRRSGREMTTTQAAPSPSSTPRRAAYLVLGMHRSGTSAVTRLLALAGAHLPDNVMPGDEHNARGYFEPWKIAIFNDQRLRAAGAAWDDV